MLWTAIITIIANLYDFLSPKITLKQTLLAFILRHYMFKRTKGNFAYFLYIYKKVQKIVLMYTSFKKVYNIKALYSAYTKWCHAGLPLVD